MHRLADGFALHDAGRDFLNRVKSTFFDRAFAIHRAAETVHHATEQSLADGHGKQFAGGLDLRALMHAKVIAEDDCADFGFFEVQRETDHAAAEVQHLVGHRVGETFDLGHAVGAFANDANVLPVHLRLHAGDLRFDFLEEVAHIKSISGFQYHMLSASASKRARTLPSKTSLPTCTRKPPINAGFTTKFTLKPCP